ncbi:hypothetical protein J6590_005977 [Homalodisca vitripennis]|nr:hypothetical protein J6590_005977 [Homalodisca vitripennis]
MDSQGCFRVMIGSVAESLKTSSRGLITVTKGHVTPNVAVQHGNITPRFLRAPCPVTRIFPKGILYRPAPYCIYPAFFNSSFRDTARDNVSTINRNLAFVMNSIRGLRKSRKQETSEPDGILNITLKAAVTAQPEKYFPQDEHCTDWHSYRRERSHWTNHSHTVHFACCIQLEKCRRESSIAESMKKLRNIYKISRMVSGRASPHSTLFNW